MRFSRGDKVRYKADNARVGMISDIGPTSGGLQYYIVFWGGLTETGTVAEIDLETFVEAGSPREALTSGRLGGYAEFQRLMTYQRLVRDEPIRNNIYAFNASRTRFYPYQFKPLIKFLDSSNHRILICDEVGLGKTIEAGLILQELRARRTMRRVLVVCPSNLTEKWRLELKQRFGEEFRIFNVGDFLDLLQEYMEDPVRTSVNAILSLQRLRADRVIEALEAASPVFDLTIVDEAHHLRNAATKQNRAASLVCQPADGVLFLSATPIQLGTQDLFQLLHLLDPESFPDFYTTEERLRQNEPIVRLQSLLSRVPPDLGAAQAQLEQAQQTPWFGDNPECGELSAQLRQLATLETEQVTAGLIDAQRRAAKLNLLGHVYTRTRKRDVQTDFPDRRPFAIEIEFTQREWQFYGAVTDYVRAQSEVEGHHPIIRQWRLNTPQRRMASSLPAMVEHYRNFEVYGDDDHDEEADGDRPANPVAAEELAAARESLRQIVDAWPYDEPDSKYEKLRQVLVELKREDGRLKMLIFAFFKGTLRYLARRLEADGIKSVLISGDVPPAERPGVISKFRDDPQIEVMLSSRVGSEGLDFQFCSTLANYDLPWNPMEVEQRIGRLDRLGQESRIIRIYNLWVKNSIEERILRKLYDRIQIFQCSIGDLELILGDTIQQMETEMFSTSLTPKQEQQRLRQTELNLSRHIDEMRGLDDEAARFIGTEEFFEQEVKTIQKRRMYVTAEQLRRFLEDFIRLHAPQARLTYDLTTRRGTLRADPDLQAFIRKSGHTVQLTQLLANDSKGVPLTFDSQVALENPGIEFINVLHPLIAAIVEEYRTCQSGHVNAHHVGLSTDKLSPGFYYCFVYKLCIQAASPRNLLWFAVLNEDLAPAVDSSTAEEIFGEMVERGTAPPASVEIDADDARDACEEANRILLDHINGLRSELQRTNDRFVDGRLQSLQTSYRKELQSKQESLSRAREEKKAERYQRMLQGTIRRYENELTAKTEELERRREIRLEYKEIANGVLEIIG